MRRLLKIVGVLGLVIALAGAGLAVAMIETTPSIARTAAPTPENVRDARRFVRGLRQAVETGQTQGEPFPVSEAELNSVLALGARFVPGFRGRVEVQSNGVSGRAAIPLPRTNERLWLNIETFAPVFKGTFAVQDVRLGALSIPPQIALEAARVGMNAVFGNRLGDTALSSATAMYTQGDIVSFDLAIDEVGKNGVMRGVFGTLRGNDMPEPAVINRYYVALREAMDRGELPTTGSYMPYLDFTLRAAYAGSASEGIANAYTAALFALTRACGARDFTMVVGGLAGTGQSAPSSWETSCEDVTLNGRIDSRRHFTTAAALQAASNRGFAISVGEFKELYDSIRLTRGGFDFTDLAANNSGIRMSNTLMSAGLEEWPRLLDRIEQENDVIISFDHVPQIMTREVFQERFGDVDSPQYAAMIEEIERQIDELPLHRP